MKIKRPSALGGLDRWTAKALNHCWWWLALYLLVNLIEFILQPVRRAIGGLIKHE